VHCTEVSVFHLFVFSRLDLDDYDILVFTETKKERG